MIKQLSFREKLGEILGDISYWEKEYFLSGRRLDDAREDRSNVIDQICKLILEEVVGANEKTIKEYTGPRNQLRASQREKLGF